MKYIKTAQYRADAKHHLLIMVDDRNYEWLSQYNWYTNGCKAAMSYFRREEKRILMSRLIMNAPDNLEVDHIDGNPLNNQRSNLRLATSSQNKMNRGPRIDNKSGYKGVSWHKQKDKWTARIMANGKYLSLGLFENILDAAKSYNSAAQKYHKDFAWLNQI